MTQGSREKSRRLPRPARQKCFGTGDEGAVGVGPVVIPQVSGLEASTHEALRLIAILSRSIPGRFGVSRRLVLKSRPYAPQLWEKFDFEHAFEIADPVGPTGAALEPDDALDGCDVIESPAAEIILEIDQLLSEFVESLMGFGGFVDDAPRSHDAVR